MDPQVGKLIEMFKAAQAPGIPRIWELPPALARQGAEAMFKTMFNAGGPEMAETRDIEIPGRRGAVRGRLYVPPGVGERSPGLLYLHGGGWVICSPDTHDRLTRELAVGIGARVVSLAYALAPEHPYPAGLDDCVDAARYLGAHGDRLGIDPGRLLIGGDSAGGNLSAATLLRLKSEPGAAFRGAIYLYGAYAIDYDTPSIKAWGDRDLILSRKSMDWFRAQYLPDGVKPDPFVSPLRGDLSGLPPAILLVGTLDPLLSDSELFADALRKVGVAAELHVYPDGPHAFAQFFALDMATDAIHRISTFAKTVLT